MSSTKLSFEVDVNQVEIKPIMKKDFLELRMKAISTANPNRNNSWFTKESFDRSKETFRNKPILGYFENGDFVSHNGEWEKDPETGIDYWDTLGKKGERILGLVRSEDEVEVVEDPNKPGLYWLTCSCALWTQYSYKQVKRLIQDAKRAKKNGGSAKNISVEVDITDYEILENDVMKINEFNLIGITILGSRNGIKVEPGIEDAELSVVDIMGKDLYERQAQSLRLAYEKLDGSDKKKEEFSKMEIENEVTEKTSVIENSDGSESAENKEPISEEHKDFAEDKCPDCGKNPCECESKCDNEDKQCEEKQCEESKCEEAKCEEKACEESKCENEEKACEEDHGEDPKDDDKDDDEKDDDKDEDDKDEDKDEDDDDNKHENESCNGCCEEEKKPDLICDLAWIISDCHWNVESLSSTMSYYENSDHPHKEYVVSVLSRIIESQKQYQRELGELLGKLSSGISEEDQAYEDKLSQYKNCYELIANYERSVEENKELSAKLANYEHKEFMEGAKLLIASAKLDDSLTAQFQKDCEEGKIKDLAELKVKVAVAAFDINNKVGKTESLSTPVAKIDTTAFAGKAEKSGKVDRWESLREYNGK